MSAVDYSHHFVGCLDTERMFCKADDATHDVLVRPGRYGRPGYRPDHGAATRSRHRSQHRGHVRRAGAVGSLRQGDGLRTRRPSRPAGQPGRGAAGQARPPADGARRRGVRGAVPRPARRHGRRRACPILENRPDCISFGAAGHLLGTQTTLRDEFTAYVPSRPHLEWQIRRRALAIPNVELVRRGVAEPQFEPGRGTRDGRAAGGRRRVERRARRPRRRRDRTRHPAAGVVGAVGLRAPRRGHRRRRHRLRHPPGAHPRRA